MPHCYTCALAYIQDDLLIITNVGLVASIFGAMHVYITRSFFEVYVSYGCFKICIEQQRRQTYTNARILVLGRIIQYQYSIRSLLTQMMACLYQKKTHHREISTNYRYSNNVVGLIPVRWVGVYIIIDVELKYHVSALYITPTSSAVSRPYSVAYLN